MLNFENVSLCTSSYFQYEECIEDLKSSKREREIEIADLKARLESLTKNEVLDIDFFAVKFTYDTDRWLFLGSTFYLM